jgi:flagellum-specific ATP synthase
LVLERCRQAVRKVDPIQRNGKIDKIIGMVIESTGPVVDIGTICRVYGAKQSIWTYAKRWASGKQRAADALWRPGRRRARKRGGSPATCSGAVGDGMVGRVIDGFGNPIDDAGPIRCDRNYVVQNLPSNPLSRPRIDEKLSIGVRAIDSLLTCGKGQRMGIFSGSGVGKSTLLGMLLAQRRADVNRGGAGGVRAREVGTSLKRNCRKVGWAVGAGGATASVAMDAAQVRDDRHDHRRILPR